MHVYQQPPTVGENYQWLQLMFCIEFIYFWVKYDKKEQKKKENANDKIEGLVYFSVLVFSLVPLPGSFPADALVSMNLKNKHKKLNVRQFYNTVIEKSDIICIL